MIFGFYICVCVVHDNITFQTTMFISFIINGLHPDFRSTVGHSMCVICSTFDYLLPRQHGSLPHIMLHYNLCYLFITVGNLVSLPDGWASSCFMYSWRLPFLFFLTVCQFHIFVTRLFRLVTVGLSQIDQRLAILVLHYCFYISSIVFFHIECNCM